MPIPDRPVDGAEIATEWGQEIHDRVFAPKGTSVNGAAGRTVGTSYAGLDMDTAIDDPGGWLVAVSDRVEAPPEAEGIYQVDAHFYVTGGSDGQTILASYALNGTPQINVPIFCETGVATQGHCNGLITIAAGDQMSCQARKAPSGGADPNVRLLGFTLVRVGGELGA